MILFIGLATVYNSAIPLGEGPDEPAHMGYVLFLARERRLPVQRADPTQSDVAGEGHQPPLAYLLALPAVFWLPPSSQQVMFSANPGFRWNGGNEPAAFMRSSNEYWPWSGLTLAWHLARLCSTLFGALTVYCVWGAARTLIVSWELWHLENGRPVHVMAGGRLQGDYALLAAALVAFNPQFLFTSALVTNDTLLSALSAALFWLCLFSPRPPPLVPRYLSLWAGGLFGLALLAKQSALLLIPLLLWMSWCLARGSVGRLVRSVVIWSSTALLLAGWWFGRNWLLYGDPMGLAKFQSTYATQPFDWHSVSAWSAALGQLFASFWAWFGWLSLPVPAWVIWCYIALVLAALVGVVHTMLHPATTLALATSAYRSTLTRDPGTLTPPAAARERVAGSEDSCLSTGSSVAPSVAQSGSTHRCSLLFLHSPWVASVVLLLSTAVWTTSFALVAGLVAWQGRMLFSALGPIAIFLAWGLSVKHREQGAPGAWCLVPGSLLFALALYLPLGVIAPAYRWYTLPPALAQERIVHPVYARYARAWEDGIELRGWRISQDGAILAKDAVVQAGEAFSITLTWQALERVPENWTVFVHFVDAAESIVAEHNSRPQQGVMPMLLWTPGDWLEDTHSLNLPSDLPAGSYRLRVGLYLPWQRDPTQGRRQEVWARDGSKMGDLVEIGTIRVVRPTTSDA